MNKATFRSRLLAYRQHLSPEHAAAHSRAILTQVQALPGWDRVRTVLLYLPVRGEVDTWPLFEWILARGCQTLLPCCRKNEPGCMDFFKVTSPKELVPGMFNIPEPDTKQCTLIEHPEPDMVILPGVGFDRRGYRLGYGGGYYDRFLARHAVESALIMGLGFSCQIVDDLPHDPWDQRVDLVVTEEEMIWTGIKAGNDT